LKKIFLLIAFIFSSILVEAQGGSTYTPLAVGFGVSSIRGYTNLAKQDNTLAFNGTFTYYATPFIPLTAELQFGHLTGGSTVSDQYGRQYSNNYQAFIVHGEIQLGELIDFSGSRILDVLKDFYAGPGFGILNNNVHNQRTNLYDTGYPVGTYVFPGSDHGINTMASFRAGYEFKFYNEFDEPYLRLDIEYVHNFVYGEGLDGYNDPSSVFKNEHSDSYRQITIGLKYSFGDVKNYMKSIRNQYY
jgi:hypothetical protein